ncbi:hypothetical protein BaRGS_00025733 [Batillaria attramentaria]|uniref:Sulfotransferase family protein n=1 Tax=Batillaria attramentaria TaxID=370345 RepID=A0ABD0K7Q8_9CAEN
MTTSEQKRILLWAVPRSLSSAMCRVMMNSGLTNQVLFEPYCGSYYFGSDRISPRYLAMDPDPKRSYDNVKRTLELPYEDKQLVFVKDMAYTLAGRMSEDWIPAGYTHTFIIRHPRAAIASYFRIIDHAGLPEWEYFDQAEAGYQEQVELSRLLKKLEAMLRAYCREIGLDFSEKMLDWKPMSDAEFQSIFGAWEPAWFGKLRSSSTIAPRINAHIETPTADCGRPGSAEDVERERIVAECLPLYEELSRVRLQA